MKPTRTAFIVVICSALLLVAGLWPSTPRDQISIGSQKFSAEFVADLQAQAKGLSDRESLGKNEAMVFVFDKPDVRCFWMKDMKFALDIIWLNSRKQINATEQNLQPSSYPTSYCHVDAQYVVEVDAGTVKRLNSQLGEQLRF